MPSRCAARPATSRSLVSPARISRAPSLRAHSSARAIRLLLLHPLSSALFPLRPLSPQLSASFIATVNLLAAAGFLIYGGRLFIMLRRFPIESKGRRKKLREVGFVTAICATCFTLRAVLVAAAAISRRFGSELDVVDHPLINAGYYAGVEIIPSALVLFILRKLPPKRSNSYQAIPTADGGAGPSGAA